ncbi:tRNA pseudouridine 13 synthase [Pseudohaliea rubra DSM 19751]|uniref:tRNA pseudouridine synthase D n=1 Tax=Pseudohaliea rubra DSM 19751 TaxID=1265313 RepID=A0A095X2E8_9GAMM|nr:tRNA pseudouridine 13 synthase [Pseudohaliea rubra DSM 19751]
MATARLRVLPEDFQVDEQLGFEPEGEGEHLFLSLRKRGLDTEAVAQRLARWAAVAPSAVSYAGRKDRHAVTTQWFSVQLPGRADPDPALLAEDEALAVLAMARHPRKLRRGVHRGNAFRLRLRELTPVGGGDLRGPLEARLLDLSRRGAPNYFGEQRFGSGGSNLAQARRWRDGGRPPGGRGRRGMLLSALRAEAFNTLLAERVRAGDWETVAPGDVCQLAGSRSLFAHDGSDDLAARAAAGDLHLALPLPGRGERREGADARARQDAAWSSLVTDLAHLERVGVELAYRAARVLPGDFAWEFCDDGSLILTFTLVTGSFATAVVAELVDYSHKEQAGP